MPPVAAPDSYPGRPGRPIYAGLTDPVPPDAPAAIRLYDWTDHTAPVLVGTVAIDTDADALTFQDATLAAEIGVVPIRRTSQGIVFDGFEFGATSFQLAPALNDEVPGDAVYQVLVACAPHGRWAGYPAFENYNAATDSTIPNPFKIQVLDGSGAVVHTYELHDGLAINDTRTSQTRTTTQPIRPLFNCAMMLPWQSARIKPSSQMARWFPGVTADSRHPTDARSGSTTNGSIPLMAGRTQYNSALQWYALPRWPLAYDEVYGSTAALNAQDPNNDTNLFTPIYYSGENVAQKAWRASGWDYEPGSISGHDWYPGPGGARFDRAYIPTALALFASDPVGVRLKNSEPLRDMAEAWSKAYFNQSFHYVRDAKTLAAIPQEEITARQWSYGYSAYYGQGNAYVVGGAARHVNPFGIPNGSGDPAPVDKDGRMPFGGVQFDDMHNYSEPGWAVLLLNSPMHLYSSRQRFASNTMSWLGAGIANTAYNFGYRQQAWRWLHYVMQWILGTSNSSMGFSRASIEAMFQQELEAIHDTMYVPAMVDLSTSLTSKALRELGIHITTASAITSGGNTWFNVPSPLWVYIAGPLQMMKQSGMWSSMRAKNSKCSLALEFVVECLDKWCLDFMVSTNGRAEYTDTGAEQSNKLSTTVATGGTPVLPSSWSDWAAMFPAIGAETWVKDAVGAWKERYAAQHLRAQWAFIRRDYFADHNPARANISEACALFDGFYAEWRAASRKWAYRIPPHGILNNGVV